MTSLVTFTLFLAFISQSANANPPTTSPTSVVNQTQNDAAQSDIKPTPPAKLTVSPDRDWHMFNTPSKSRHVQPTSKLGLPLEESKQLLSPEIKLLLDGVKRLYITPGLLANRNEVFKLVVGIPQEKTIHADSPGFKASRSSFLETLTHPSIASSDNVKSYYTYSTWRELPDEEYRIALDIRINWKTFCINSAAVEGYLDIALESGLPDSVHLTYGPNSFDRRKPGGHGPRAPGLTKNSPSLLIEWIDNCISSILLEGYWKVKEVSNEKVS
jgi:hypothetical protein